ncbi:MAG TPA: hypothetical protein VF065_18260 [Ilumatobacter sp.]
MTGIEVTVRDDLAEAHRLAWEHIASPGSWWTAAQRVELAQTTMLALADPDPLPPWVGVTTSGRLPHGLLAPAAAQDFAYRLARHAGTITRDVYDSVSADIGELPFVEVCAIVSTVAAVWHFCRNVGIPVPLMPAPVPGEPTGRRPDDLATAELNWVPVAAPADEVAAVVQAYTAVPGEQDNTWRMADAQYMPNLEMVDPAWSRRPDGLSRAQMELVAARVTQLRDCFY